MNLHQQIHQVLAKRGYQVRQHPAARRQQMFAAKGVDLVLDVGAAVGAYGTELRGFGYPGRIVSFEPLSEAYAALLSVCDPDPDWVAVHTALGEDDGEAEINVAGNSDSSSLLPMLDAHRAVAPHANYIGVETIRVQKLDDVAAEHTARAQHPFLKIDTQGFERHVLAGATKTMPTVVGLQVELSFVPLYEGSMLAHEAISALYEQGFLLEALETGLRDPVTGQMLQADGLFFRQ